MSVVQCSEYNVSCAMKRVQEDAGETEAYHAEGEQTRLFIRSVNDD